MARGSEKRKEETREKIISAACELFSKYGYHNTQVMDIVKAVGMSAGTFYNHFLDKKDLYRQLTLQSLESLRINVKKMREPVDIWNPSARSQTLQEMFDAIFDYIDANPQQFIMLLRGGFGVDEELDGNVWNYFLGFAEDAGEDIQRWMNEGVIEGIDPMFFGHACVGMCIQAIHSYLIDKRNTREEVIGNLIKMILAMFEAYLTEEGRRALEAGDIQATS
ncbi:MAG: TetR/AcrR family transcriptional regulator [Desulfomonilia bacterium]|jgi:AcrR family transcriptional regulator|uniref:HTH-type transcriptional regulator AcrR n=1 Tax=anaerobic digester metagenome TaxID=1263854 RepID=A0A485LUL8_9ZZZZ|nr:TetR/AcrR family transcriptional regulator [Pseudomonadota bacterium]HON38892.1 TetR/AcrR family transcriptional regulator [Deltaproteobacteria bacterium]HRS56114.1 TetR/AcrR family transcriptional regulator [Desulfomonilia bacterium]HPD22355.1 TetR/AcrR family transcriptional regulator [Deltaproteobacteria bacterium]HPW69528.1 TetR/AcrR family transcriptional regulator [Deltaproteobacteria bacterium]